MKKARGLLALLFAILTTITMSEPAMAEIPYTPVKPAVMKNGLGLNEELEVTEPGATNPIVTYTLTLGNIQSYQGYGDISQVKNVDAVNGKILGTVTFNAGEVSNGTPVTKDYIVSDEIVAGINKLEFDRPGIYYWEINKTSSSTDTALSNHNRASISNHGTALVIRVDDVNGTLTPTVSVNVFEDADKPTLGNKNTAYKDNYAAQPGTLTLKKAVTGNQGEKDRYYKFTVTLTELGKFDNVILTPTGSNTALLATAKYNESINGTNNLSPVTINGGSATFTFWLRDQEEVQIPHIPGIGVTKYAIQEEEVEGYTTTYDIEYQGPVTDDKNNTTTGTVLVEENGNSIDARLLSNDRVVFENDRASSTPTGVILQKAAPIAGILLAVALASVVLIGKRHRSDME